MNKQTVLFAAAAVAAFVAYRRGMLNGLLPASLASATPAVQPVIVLSPGAAAISGAANQAYIHKLPAGSTLETAPEFMTARPLISTRLDMWSASTNPAGA